MQNLKFLYKSYKRFYPVVFSFLLIILSYNSVIGQGCPQNIDFETGTFSGWTCYTGSAAAVGNQNVLSLTSSGGPVPNRHTMYSGANASDVDYYGRFPVLCPNGSGHSIRLGNNAGGGEAEGISYEFTIPANQNSYSLIFHYAVVFQAPNHRENEQPRMEIEVTNVTDNSVISCASFTFIAVGTSLPGFQVSQQSDTTAVLYKDWSAVSVDLAGNAGKTIKLFFKTADCTFRRHFGYAYIDVDSECSGMLAGATYCPDDTAINVMAPYGYQGYTWYDSALTRVLGTQQILHLSPPPPSGTTLAVQLAPFDGFGCPQTLFTKLKDSLTVVANAGRDTLSCNKNPVPIGTSPKTGFVYKWRPAAGLSNPDIANPFASPDTTTTYIVQTSNSGGGCLTTDTVVVKTSKINDSLTLIGKPIFCIDNGDSAILNVSATSSIQWFRDDNPINGERKTFYRVSRSGTYYALLTNALGCVVPTAKQDIIIDKAKPGISYPDEYAVINIPLLLQARSFGESVVWSPGISLNSTTSVTPTFKGVVGQLYTITIKTNTGCITVDTQLVKTIKNVEVYVPTGFTPNSDGMNDYLHPILKGVKDIHFFRVYNRLGQILFEMKSNQQGWNGTFKGIPQQTQTVVWVFEGIGVDGVTYVQKGTSVLIR